MPPVGASLLAMDVNDGVGCLSERGVLAFFASRLAPTNVCYVILNKKEMELYR
jgi:hypothetical protein